MTHSITKFVDAAFPGEYVGAAYLFGLVRYKELIPITGQSTSVK
jgi:hypothetical protein